MQYCSNKSPFSAPPLFIHTKHHKNVKIASLCEFKLWAGFCQWKKKKTTRMTQQCQTLLWCITCAMSSTWHCSSASWTLLHWPLLQMTSREQAGSVYTSAVMYNGRKYQCVAYFSLCGLYRYLIWQLWRKFYENQSIGFWYTFTSRFGLQIEVNQ